MRSRAITIIQCMVAALAISSAFALPAFADLTGSFDPEAFYQAQEERSQAFRAMLSSEDWAAHQEAANQIVDRIRALPETATILDSGEIKDLRRTYNEWKEEEAWLLVAYGVIPPSDLHDDYPINNTLAGYTASSMENDTYGCIARLERAEKQLESQYPIITIILAAWSTLYIVQLFLAYGSAYRTTRRRGDSGVSLFGWMIVYNLAALVPFLGIGLWSRTKRSVSADAAEPEQASESSEGAASK